MSRSESNDSDASQAAANEPQLEPQLDARWALTVPQLLMVAGIAALYLVVSYLPLTDPALWNAVNYGDWILAHEQLPTSDWMMPYAEAMPLIDRQWASEVVLAKVAGGGDTWLTTLAGVLVAATFAMLGRAYWLRSRQAGVTLVVTAAVFAMAWTRYTTLRPEHFGMLCLAGLLWWCAAVRDGHPSPSGSTSDSWLPRKWFALAALFCAWANLHPTFVWGLVILACGVVGTAVDACRRDGTLRGLLADRGLQRATFALQAALLATCVNPHGVDLLLQAVWYAPWTNVVELPDWQPLVLLRSAGPAFALSIVVLLVLLRLSRAQLATADVLALAAMAVATVLHQRYIAFYAAVLGFLAAQQLAAIWASWRRQDGTLSAHPPARNVAAGPAALPAGRAWAYSLLALLSVWIAFSLSDASRPLLGGKPRAPAQLYGPQAPFGLLEYLAKNPPAAEVFAPAGWGDWLYRQSAGRVQPFATSRVEALPRQAWIDYNSVASSQSGWRNVLRRYQVKTMLVDRTAQPGLVSGLRLDPDWNATFQDPIAMVFTTGDATASARAEQEDSYE